MAFGSGPALQSGRHFTDLAPHTLISRSTGEVVCDVSRQRAPAPSRPLPPPPLLPRLSVVSTPTPRMHTPPRLKTVHRFWFQAAHGVSNPLRWKDPAKEEAHLHSTCDQFTGMLAYTYVSFRIYTHSLLLVVHVLVMMMMTDDDDNDDDDDDDRFYIVLLIILRSRTDSSLSFLSHVIQNK